MSSCVHCGQPGHAGKCPLVKAIEYYEDGSLKRVEYITPADSAPNVHYYPHYSPPYYNPVTVYLQPMPTYYGGGGTCASSGGGGGYGGATGGTTICG